MTTAPTLRGKGVSKDKFTKDGRLKRSGNFSYSTIHYQSLQCKDYKVRLIDKQLIVGTHTPLSSLYPQELVNLALNDGYFERYVRNGVKTINGKQYEVESHLTRRHIHYDYNYINYEFTYREMIYTDGDFDYNFPEY